ncbi:hypothetical protein LOK49_LG05G01387 [Camellia lanceoleosa]|uniref:Uncharacterized protein n=1 Tax=Camellia lanceoleosa TaxID=1840588 RepID=A0ACC0HUT6_9ERIC|nr:hypothetical protein LOK49_LG05G01387 [Camellia lanceoleosa]
MKRARERERTKETKQGEEATAVTVVFMTGGATVSMISHQRMKPAISSSRRSSCNSLPPTVPENSHSADLAPTTTATVLVVYWRREVSRSNS